MTMLVAIAAFVVAALQQAPAQARVEESRLLRIHLRNGDYIEGRIRSETSSLYEIRVEDGSLLLPRSQIARMEPVLMRTHEPPKPPPAPPIPTDGARPRPKYLVLVPQHIVHSIRFRVDAILEANRRGTIPRDDAMRRLLECGPEGALYLTTLLEPLDDAQRGLALQCLSLLKNAATLPTVTELLDSEDPDIRVMAAGLAGTLGDKAISRRLRGLLKDREPSVRAAALAAFNQLDDPEALDHIGPLCSDPDPGPRAAALEATVQLAQRHERRESLLWALDRALRWPPKGGEPEILKAIGNCGDPEAWTLAVAHLRSASEKTRTAAATALGVLGAVEAGTAIAQQMDVEHKEETRIQLAFAAERAGVHAAVPTLIEWLASTSVGVRRAALRALRTLSGERWDEDPAAWTRWWVARAENDGK